MKIQLTAEQLSKLAASTCGAVKTDPPTAAPLLKLHDGNVIPQLGLGVWQMSDDIAQAAVTTALAAGYRMIDTATIYKNEVGVGRALQAAMLPRSTLFITTKLWNSDQLHPQQALTSSLQKLQLDYVDLYLIHWPTPLHNRYVDVWRSLLQLQKQGLARSVGVSNFNCNHLQRLLDETGFLPTINQVELHPLFQQTALRTWHHEHNIVTESWSPLAHGGVAVFDQPTVQQLAKKYNKSPAQIVIRWHLDNNLVVIPKSATAARIIENFQVFDFHLLAEEMAAIAAMDKGARIGSDPEHYN